MDAVRIGLQVLLVLGGLFLSSLLILMHKGKGGGMSDMFGGGMSSSLGGSSVAERNLDRITIGVGPRVVHLCRGSGRPRTLRRLGQGAVMAGGNAIRGSRVGAGPAGEAERGEVAPRVHISFWCSNGHETRPSFSQEPGLVIPEQWDCPRAAGSPPGATRTTRRHR